MRAAPRCRMRSSPGRRCVAAKASAASTREQIRANEIALEGVEREAIVGSRTTLDVLNAQQALLNSRITLVQNLAQVVNDLVSGCRGDRAADRARPASAGAAVRRDGLLSTR